MFYFYASPAEPFLILAVVYVLGALINGPGVGRLGQGRVRTSDVLPAEDRRLYGTIFAAAFVVLVAICFWWYYPLYRRRFDPVRQTGHAANSSATAGPNA